MIVHYLPPHQPYGSRAIQENRPLTELERNPWASLKRGVPREELWETYLGELRFVMDSVQTLIRNIDADDIVISADHGEAFGEFGVYAHPMLPIPALRSVPWVKTTGLGQDEYNPRLTPPTEGGDNLEEDVEEQLELLGYR
jgi:hypothetical protein